MKAIIQRVNYAKVETEGKVVAEIGKGMLVLVGIKTGDTVEQAKKLADKLVKLRIFEDESKKMNKSLLDIKGELLLVSQFTLIADTQKGNRPSFIQAERPEKAKQLYQILVDELKKKISLKNRFVWSLYAGFFAKRWSSNYYIRNIKTYDK
ncbi:MAG: D-aminoacyl-tRNA deacylase [Patescibacteria group bacterium]|nr:MAG: D-aminoacyl-tRNA deacylase [Patescibacteria group bacterium]